MYLNLAKLTRHYKRYIPFGKLQLGPCQNVSKTFNKTLSKLPNLLHMISGWYNLKKGFRIWIQKKTKDALFYMHWENKLSLFLKYLGNERKTQIFQTHFQFISSTNHMQEKQKTKKITHKSMHICLKRGTLINKNFLTFYFRFVVEIRTYRFLIIKVNSLNVTKNISLELKNMNFHWQQWKPLFHSYFNIF